MANYDGFHATTEIKIVSKVKSTIYTKKQNDSPYEIEPARTTLRRRTIQGQSSLSRSKTVDLDNVTYASTYTTETSNGIVMTRTLVYLSHDEILSAQQTSTYLGPVVTDGRLVPITISSVKVESSSIPSATIIPKAQTASNNSWQVPVIVAASVIFFILPFGLGLFLWSCCAKRRRERERAGLPISRPLPPSEIKESPISRPVTPRPPMSPREPVSSSPRTYVPFYVPKLKYLNGPRIEDFPAPPVPPKPPGHIKIPAKARRTTSSLYSRSTLFFTQGYSPARLSKHTDRTPSPDPTSPTSIRAPFRLIRPRSLPTSIMSPNHSPSGSKSSSKSRMDSEIDPELNVVADGLKVESIKGSRRSFRMTLNSPTIPRNISGSSASSSTASRETIDWDLDTRSGNHEMMIPIVLERRDTHGTLDAVLEEMWADEHHP